MMITWLYIPAGAGRPATWEGYLPTTPVPSYLLRKHGKRWLIEWLNAADTEPGIRTPTKASARSIGGYAHPDAARAVAQAHADEWKMFGVLWHDREHYGPDATDDFTLEAFNYFRAGLQRGRTESQ